MKFQKMNCPFCGAPLSYTEGSAKVSCKYCGNETVLESEFIDDIEKKVVNSIKTDARLELKRLQVAQEISTLQMQIGNLRAERRALESSGAWKNRQRLQQLFFEEKELLGRIATLQNSLTPEDEAVPPPPPSAQDGVVLEAPESNKSWGTTLFLACTLGIWGAHRYYVGRVGSAVIQTFTLGGFYFWWIIDIIAILAGNFTDVQGRPLNRKIKANPALMKGVGGFYIWLATMMIFVYSVPEGETPSGPYAVATFLVPVVVAALLVNLRPIYRLLTKRKGNS
jgi:LSD1 subclass zinc finger protein